MLSALRAPFGRADAIKFALRNVGGILLYVAAANLLRAPAAALTTTVAMTIGAVVAAWLMWAELHVAGAAAPLRAFHPAPSTCSGLPRASGPFQYPNIAAMYLEAALPRRARDRGRRPPFSAAGASARDRHDRGHAGARW